MPRRRSDLSDTAELTYIDEAREDCESNKITIEEYESIVESKTIAKGSG